jgi:hypothetical protein
VLISTRKRRNGRLALADFLKTNSMLSLPSLFESGRPLGNLVTIQSPAIESFGLEVLQEARRETSPAPSRHGSGSEPIRLLSNASARVILRFLRESDQSGLAVSASGRCSVENIAGAYLCGNVTDHLREPTNCVMRALRTKTQSQWESSARFIGWSSLPQLCCYLAAESSPQLWLS